MNLSRKLDRFAQSCFFFLASRKIFLFQGKKFVLRPRYRTVYAIGCLKSFGNLSEKENAGSGSGFHLNDDSRFTELHFFSFFQFFIARGKFPQHPKIFPYGFANTPASFLIFPEIFFLRNLKGKNETLLNVTHALIPEDFKPIFRLRK